MIHFSGTNETGQKSYSFKRQKYHVCRYAYLESTPPPLLSPLPPAADRSNKKSCLSKQVSYYSSHYHPRICLLHPLIQLLIILSFDREARTRSKSKLTAISADLLKQIKITIWSIHLLALLLPIIISCHLLVSISEPSLCAVIDLNNLTIQWKEICFCLVLIQLSLDSHEVSPISRFRIRWD